MAHGQPDFGAQASKETVYGQADIGELAARLGSIVTFDRRGDVVWLDDFESGIEKWNLTLQGLGATIDWSTIAARSGAFSAKLTAGSTLTHLAHIARGFSPPVPSRIGVEFHTSQGSTYEEIICTLYLYDGVNHIETGIKHNYAAQQLSYRDDAFAWVPFANGIQLFQMAEMLHSFKMVFDLVTKRYVRVIFNNLEYDLSAIPLYSVLSAFSPRCVLILQNTGRLANNDYIYIDDVIFTQNEP